MSAELSTLEVRVTGRIDELEASLDEAERKAGEKGRSVAQRFSKELVAGARRLGDAMSLALTLPLTAGLAKAVKASSDLGEAQNAAVQVFKRAIGVIDQFAAVSARSFAVSSRAAYEHAATLGSIFKASGLAERAAAEMSVRTVQLAADLASLKNLRVEDALEKLRSGLVGQIEPLRSVGVLLSEQVLTRRAQLEGFDAEYKKLSEGAKVYVRYKEVLAQTADAHGDIGRTSGELANSQRILAAEWEDVSAKLGENFLPVAKEAVGWIRRIAETIGGMDDGQRKAFGYTLVALAAAGPVLSGLARLAQAWAAVQAAATAAAAAQATAAAAGAAGAGGALARFGAIGRVGAAGAGLALGYGVSEAVFGHLGRAADEDLKRRVVAAAEEYNRLRASGPARLEDSRLFMEILGRPRRDGLAQGLLPPGMQGQRGDPRYDALSRAVLAAADELHGAPRSAPSQSELRIDPSVFGPIGGGGRKQKASKTTGRASGKPRGGGYEPLDPFGKEFVEVVLHDPELEARKAANEAMVRLQERMTEQTRRTRLEAEALVAVRDEDRIALLNFGKEFDKLTSDENRRLVSELAGAERLYRAHRDRADAESQARDEAERRNRQASVAVQDELARLSDLLGLTRRLSEAERAMAVARRSGAPPLAAGILRALGEAADQKKAKEKIDQSLQGRFLLFGLPVPRDWAVRGLEEEKRLREAAEGRFEEAMQRLAERSSSLGPASEAYRYRLERLASAFGVGKTEAERMADGMERAQRVMEETLRVERIEEARQALERLTQTVEDRFMALLDGVLRTGFRSFFADVMAGFRQMLADMAREWLLSQVRRGVAGLLGGLVGTVFGAPSSSGGRGVGGGSGLLLLNAPGGNVAPPGVLSEGGGGGALVPAGPGWSAGGVTVVVNVSTPDARSFLASEGQVAEAMGRAASRAVRRNG
ncbi:MAG: hypothetical protein KIS64_09695 [Fimbriimonadaceae bacterium]|nr:hypothetical protein [Fimbriimonadaceae bacterium]